MFLLIDDCLDCFFGVFLFSCVFSVSFLLIVFCLGLYFQWVWTVFKWFWMLFCNLEIVLMIFRAVCFSRIFRLFVQMALPAFHVDLLSGFG